MLLLLCLSEAEDLGVQFVVFTVKLEITCLWVCTESYIMCRLSLSVDLVHYINLRLVRKIKNETKSTAEQTGVTKIIFLFNKTQLWSTPLLVQSNGEMIILLMCYFSRHLFYAILN